MPLEVRGHLDLPEEPDDPPAVELLIQDGKAIGEVEAVVQNFIAPDPLAGLVVPDRPVAASPGPPDQERSEEHTSELQSLMRTSYAVFCLQTKTKDKQTLSKHTDST